MMTSDTIDLPAMHTLTASAPMCRSSAFDATAEAPSAALLRFLDRALTTSSDSGQRVGVMIIELDGLAGAGLSDPGAEGDLLTQVNERGRGRAVGRPLLPPRRQHVRDRLDAR